MEQNMFLQLQQQMKRQELANVDASNRKSEQFGLTLTEEEEHALIVSRDDSLKKYHRVEFGAGILPQLIESFCDSPYLNQTNYAESLKQLIEVFYEFKNESEDMLTDDELLSFMREQFDAVCFGDIEYLADTCLERFAAAVRAGYRGYEQSGGQGEYQQFDEEKRWDEEVYRQALTELFWS